MANEPSKTARCAPFPGEDQGASLKTLLPVKGAEVCADH